MFVTQAHSFTQQARLAITLAWVAGYTNIITFLTCATMSSHVSGTASLVGRDIARGSWRLAAWATYLLATFLLGAILSGLTTEHGRRRLWESIYVLPIAIEAVLLCLFAVIQEFRPGTATPSGTLLYAMTGLASCAMGLQNATITRISGGVVRTTHVTGVLTDLGLEIAHLAGLHSPPPPPAAGGGPRETPDHQKQIEHSAQARRDSRRRLLLLLSIFGSFALGAGLGTWAMGAQARFAMFPPVLFLVWIIYQDITRPIAEIEPSDLVSDDGWRLPPGLSIFRVSKDKTRPGGVHTLPNLLAWADRLPPDASVIILDLAHVEHLHKDAAFELRALAARFSAQGRHLILTGLNPAQYNELCRAANLERLEWMTASPDLELALAHGLNLLHP